MTTPGESLQISTAAGAEAGTRSADSTTVSCDLIRVGMFFDGTGNSREHVGTRHIDSWHSNVDLLERRYRKSTRPVQVNRPGVSLQAVFGSRYIRGVGIEEGGGNQQWGIPRGIAWGTGPEGVAARTREGLEQAREEIRTRARGLEPCFVWLDTFGFSRGACVARDFANDIKDGAIRFAGRTAQVKFMGLWDTVSSIGSGGNTGGWADEGVRIGTSGTAQDIVHITAEDEFRANFPLTRARNEKRIRMVGAHSDIGGGYAPGRNRGVISYRSGTHEAFFDTVARKWELTLGAWEQSLSMRWRQSARVNGDQLSEMIAGYSFTKSFSWEAEHGLQFVSLRIMHDQARAKGVPLEPLGTSIEGISVEISGDLLDYYDQIKDAPHRSDSATELNIRRKHAHMSVGNSIGMGASDGSEEPEARGIRNIAVL